MKFKSKQFISRFMAVVLSVCMLMCSGLSTVSSYIMQGIIASAADITIVASGSCGAEGDNVTYTLDSEGTLIISGSGRMRNYFGNNSPFYSNSNIQTVVINNGVTSIGNHVFSNCKSLTIITIPKSVTSIGTVINDSFENCTGLASIDVSKNNTVYSSDNGVLLDKDQTYIIRCPEGKKGTYTIPSSVTSIGYHAFESCTGLTSITIPESVTSIKIDAFSCCKSITSITIPDSVKSIESGAFAGCKGLTSITIPNSVTTIEACLFEYCTGLTSITIPNNVTCIGFRAFKGCTSLTSITIPDSVMSIGGEAFKDCTVLTSIAIPNSVISIGDEAFNGCENLASISVIGNNAIYSSDNGVLLNKDKTEIIICPEGKKGTYVIPNSVTSIGKEAFWNCKALTSITIPNGVTSIGDGVFYGCISLTSVTIPDSVNSIGRAAFGHCESLKSITIPNSVITIESADFQQCTSLTSISLPDSVSSIGKDAFSGCIGLTSVTIPDNVTSIGEGAFEDCTGLTSITIPNSVTSIGKFVFYGCTDLTSIEIPENVTSIGWCAFFGCNKLKDVYYWGTEEEWSKISINSNNEYFTNATIHYNSVISNLYYSSSSNYVIVNGFNWARAEFDFQTSQKEMTKAEAEAIVDGIKWNVSDPEIIQIQDVSYDKHKNVKGTTISIYLDIKATKPGKVTITGTTADGKTASATLYAEPEISLFQSTSSSGAKKDFFNCQVELNYDDKDYLEQFVKTLTVSGKNVNSEIGDVSISKESYGWLAKFDITAIGTGKTECTVRSPGGQFQTKSIDIDNDSHYSPVYEMKKGKLSSGILQSVDSAEKKVTIDGVNYDVNDSTVVSAKDILANKNLEDKTVIVCSDNNVITSIESVYDVMKPAVFLEVKDEPFIFTGGSYNKLSSEMMMTISIDPDPTYDYQDLKKLGLPVSIKTAILSSYNGKINFGKNFLLNQTSVTDEMDGEKVLRLEEKLVRTYTVNIDKNYVPENVITRADFDVSVTIKGLKNQQKLYAWFDIGNLDKQSEAEKTQHQTINQEAGNELKDSLNKLDKANVCTLSGLGDVFSAKDVQKIQNFLCVYVAEIMAVPTVEESGFFEKIADKAKSRLKSEMYKAFGIKEELLPQNKTQQVTVSVAAYTKENKIAVIDFSIDVDSHILSGKEYGRLCYVNYTYRDVSVLPKYAQQTGKGQIATYNLKAFAESILDYVKYSYMECWGKNANTIVAMFKATPLDILFDGNFSSHLFDMTKKIVKVSTGEIKEEDLIKEEGKRIANKTYEHIKKTVIKCPVDVYVYDSDSKIVAAIINNTVQKEYQGVYCNVIGDEKYIYLSEDDYSLKLIGNGDGFMEYYIEEYTGDVLSRTVSVKNVPLTGNKVYESFVPHISYIDSKVYDLISDTDEVIPISDDSLINLAIKGDTNGDGKATIADSLMIARYEVKLRTLTDEQLAVSDVNYDGKVTIADALKIARYEVKLIDSL